MGEVFNGRTKGRFIDVQTHCKFKAINVFFLLLFIVICGLKGYFSIDIWNPEIND